VNRVLAAPVAGIHPKNRKETMGMSHEIKSLPDLKNRFLRQHDTETCRRAPTHRVFKQTGATCRFARRGVKESGVARRRARLAGKERSEQTSSHRPRRTLARAFQI
jgi:hypothetical protein